MNCFAKFLAARMHSFSFAIAGLLSALKTEGNLRVHLVAALIVVGLGAGLSVNRLEWAALTVAIGLVWVAELLNTALEALCDLLEPNHSAVVKRVKDIAAAAVLAAAITAATIGALVFWPYMFG